MNDYTIPTTGFWQELRQADAGETLTAPYRYRYPVALPDGQILDLPLRRLTDEPDRAVASFLANHAAFNVVDTLAAHMADLARQLDPQVIIGLPTLGLTFAPLVARHLGFTNYVPFGYSRKYWYDDQLSVAVRSITTPGGAKSLYVDPNILPRIHNRRALIVDDAISSGQTIAAALQLVELAGATVDAVVVAMIQGERWRSHLAQAVPAWNGPVHGVFYAPRFIRSDEGWLPHRDA
ncbi:MAG TPA: phosphoribosyltransferase [Roseiflexaceae bacterium]|nr:phosphoribosyltransferase [Roseiflexaceae bacterium]HMP43183.1 phosphoribosyltransferase [Roseiflexaceae bacterium]